MSVSRHFFLIAYCLLTAAANAQSNASTAGSRSPTSQLFTDVQTRGVNLDRATFVFDNRYEGVRGTPFLYDFPTLGRVLLRDSIRSRDSLNLMFDLQGNLLWVVTNPVTIEGAQLPSDRLLGFSLYRMDGSRIHYESLDLNRRNGEDLLCLVLHQGKALKLVSYQRKILKKADLRDNGLTTAGFPYDRFIRSYEYWIKRSSGTYEKVTLRRKNLVSMLPANMKVKAERYCENARWKSDLTEKQVVELFQYLEKM
jgi:hypothetical protein